MKPVVIAGGGIGGLAAALGLANNGHQVTVLERRDAFSEIGAGIQLAPNAFAALAALGVDDAVRDRAVHIDELRLMDGTTEEQVGALSLGESYRHRFGHAYVVVHRADLYEPLLRACRLDGRVELRANAEVDGFEQNRTGVTVTLASGEILRGSALIGADGLRSTVRGQIVGDGEPRVSGHTIYRSVIPMERVPRHLRWNAVALWAGPKWHVVHYPIAGGRQFNLAATHDDGAGVAVAGLAVERRLVLSAFSGAGRTVRRLLELAKAWRTWVVCDRDPVDRWTDGRVALLGDAAHPMLQYAAQGACMAVEDAVELAGLLKPSDDHDDVACALATYAKRRGARTARTQLVSREMGRLYHMAGAEAQERNAMLSALSQEELFEKVAWLHDGPYHNARTGS